MTFSLIDNEVSERKAIEYKQALPSGSAKDKKEFLADVSSFANAGGGDLIYGMTEDKKTGKPKSLDGLDIKNPDQEIQRLDNLIRTGIQPRLPTVTISPRIPLQNSRVVLVIRVAKSWISPHRVIYEGHDKFYSRSSNGKYPLDVSELRTAFNLSEAVTDRIRSFRQDRISRILANETPIAFYEGAKIILHLIPLISFSHTRNYDTAKIASQPTKMPPMNSNGWNRRYNLDGFLTYSSDKTGKSKSYVQLYRNGIIEAVDRSIFGTGSTKIYGEYYEPKLVESCKEYLSIMKELAVEPPIFLFITLVGVKGFSMAVSKEKYDVDETYQIDRDILLLPEVVIYNYGDDTAKLVRPCFDAIWNACGFAGWLNDVRE